MYRKCTKYYIIIVFASERPISFRTIVFTFLKIEYIYVKTPHITSAAGVVVSCKIPILATRVRFPGGAAGDIAQW
jgi:hypothetical protein